MAYFTGVHSYVEYRRRRSRRLFEGVGVCSLIEP